MKVRPKPGDFVVFTHVAIANAHLVGIGPHLLVEDDASRVPFQVSFLDESGAPTGTATWLIETAIRLESLSEREERARRSEGWRARRDRNLRDALGVEPRAPKR